MKNKEKSTSGPLRVLHVCDLQAGGIASMVLAVCEQTDREKVNFDYLVYRNREEFWDKKVRELGGRKFIADNTGAPNRIARFLWKFFRTWKVLKRERPRIFHICVSTPYDCLVGIAARLAGVKHIILHAQNSHLKKDGAGHRMFQGLCRACIPLCGDYYFSCSDVAGEFMYGKRRQKKVIYVKNAIHTDDFRFCEDLRVKMRERYGLKEELVIGSLGRFCEQKNQRFLLEIFAGILELRPNARLLLIGQGELEEELMCLADSLGIRDNLIHIASTDQVREFLCMMDIFLLPSLYEGLPLVGVEAQACGLPCVFSTSISKEVLLTDRAYALSLRRPAKEWARFAVAAAEKPSEGRAEYADHVKDAGYEIRDTAKWLEKFYLNL